MRRPDRKLAQSFALPGVVAAYRHRPPYPDAVFATLLGLISDKPRRVLDLGAGEGAIARRLAPYVDQIDAVELSEAMIEAGRRRPGGDAPNLHWQLGAAESCPLGGRYALVVAGASFHWFDWSQTLGRLPAAISDQAVLALADYELCEAPWQDQLAQVIAQFSRSTNHDPHFDIGQALEATGHYEPLGAVTTAPTRFRQRVGDYIEQFHSTASLARELMSAHESESFDRQLTNMVAPYAHNDKLQLHVQATVRWGASALARRLIRTLAHPQNDQPQDRPLWAERVLLL